jgi:hypothetical protein
MEKTKEPLLASHSAAKEEENDGSGILKKKGDTEQLALDRAMADQVRTRAWLLICAVMHIVTLC